MNRHTGDKNIKDTVRRESLETKFYGNFVKYFEEHKNNYKQADIIRIIQERYGYPITQSTVSKYVNGTFKAPNMFHILLICSAVNLDPRTLINELRTDSQEKTTEILVSDIVPQADYAPYIGIFHCYFFSTVSKQSQRDQMHHAIMQIFYDEPTNSYQVDFILHANAIGSAKRETEKKYHGTITVLNNLNACYIILQEKCLEYSFLTFRRMTTTQQSMKCCLAIALTTGAGQGRNPTAHRMVICRDELTDTGIQAIMPHLRMNSKKILIPKQDLESFLNQPEIPEAVKGVIRKNVEEAPQCH